MTYGDRKCAVCAAEEGVAAHYAGSPIRVRGESEPIRAQQGSPRDAKVGDDRRLRAGSAGDLTMIVC